MITRKNHPLTVQLGDVRNVVADDLPHVNLLMGGSPCQGFSFAGKQLNFDDPRSALFFEFVRLLKECEPDYFLLENVMMKKEFKDIITEHLGVEPVMINSSLVSAQNRKRLYWTNIPEVGQPDDKGILLKDVLEDFVGDRHSELEKHILSGKAVKTITRHNNRIVKEQRNPDKSATIHAGYYKMGGRDQQYLIDREPEVFVDRDKSYCIDANYFKGGNLKSYFEKHRRQLVFSKDGLCHVGDADIKGNDSIKRVYHEDGKCPTLTTMGGGHREPKVLISNVAKVSVKGGAIRNQVTKRGIETQLNIRKDDKSNCVVASWSHKLNGVVEYFDEQPTYRKLTPVECERLQTLPDNYTEGVSNTQRYKALGNGWTVDVIVHILQGLKWLN
jgi:DNA (cytosine-5)-methyltransferase 3A